jgi:hypothetical protein
MSNWFKSLLTGILGNLLTPLLLAAIAPVAAAVSYFYNQNPQTALLVGFVVLSIVMVVDNALIFYLFRLQRTKIDSTRQQTEARRVNASLDDDKEPIDSPRRKLQRAFPITDKHFDGDSQPQRIHIEFTNRTSNIITIEKVKYADTGDFRASNLVDRYGMDDRYYLIPSIPTNGQVSPGEKLSLDLELRGIHAPSDINRFFGHLGYLLPVVGYLNEKMELFYSI